MLVKNDFAGARVSVIIPARNARRTIGETLRSLISEAPLIQEILVIDDASADGTGEFAASEGRRLELPVRVLRSKAGNAGAARNCGLDEARAPYIYFIDADDVHVRGGLAMLRERLADSVDCGAAVGAYVREEDGYGRRIKTPARYSASTAANSRGLVAGRLRSIAIGSALFRREAIGRIRFPEATVYDEDTIFFAAVLARARVARTDKVVAVYKVDSARSDERFCARPRQSFLAWRRALRASLGSSLDPKTAKQREGLIALKIARASCVRRDADVAKRFIRVALAAPLRMRDRGRALRYRARIARLGASRPLARAGARPVAPAGADAGRRGIALVTVDPAWPPISGAELRNWSNALAAARLGPASLISLGGLRTAETEASGIRLHPLSPAPAFEIYRRPPGGTVIDVTIPEWAIERLSATLAELRPATVVVESLILHPLLRAIRPLVPNLVLDLHNIESDLLRQMRRGFFARLFGHAARRVAEVRAVERSAGSLVDEFWLCSETDAARLRKLVGAGATLRVVPNGIPRIDRVPAELPERGRGIGPMLLFLGHLSYPPNVLAARALAREIFPKIRRRLPESRLVLAGRNPKPRVKLLAGGGVEVVADPDDVSGLLSAAHFAVMPIAMGGGTRIKALEAMAWGIPLVASARAVEGLGLVDRKTVRLAETADEFCGAVTALWNGADTYEAQRRAAREYALGHFAPEAIAAAMRVALAPARHAQAIGE
jgi:glycosyltransferase involved in cell wall biosynthesis